VSRFLRLVAVWYAAGTVVPGILVAAAQWMPALGLSQ